MRIFLLLFGLGWIGYGAYVFYAPEFLAEMTGMQFTTTVARVEAQAMYGGLQIALGFLAVLGAWKPKHYQLVNLRAWPIIMLGLILGRGIGLLLNGWQAEAPGYYNIWALFGFEIPAFIVFLYLNWRLANKK